MKKIITSVILCIACSLCYSQDYGHGEKKLFKKSESISGNSYLKTGSYWADYSRGKYGNSIFTSFKNFMSMKWIGKNKKITIYHLNPTADFRKKRTAFKIKAI